MVCRVSLGHGPGTEQDVGAEGWGLLQGGGSGSRGLRCGDQGQGWSPDCPPRTQLPRYPPLLPAPYPPQPRILHRDFSEEEVHVVAMLEGVDEVRL